MDNSGPDYCYRCKECCPCQCDNPVITHDAWIEVLEGALKFYKIPPIYITDFEEILRERNAA